jgi:LPXTG-site transpeptidase (sortase) family protein
MDKQIVEEIETKVIEVAETWQIEIPKISLIANIAEGTTKDILNKYVGHFENTSRKEGNIGLAAHNRGYEVNYFKDLKLLTKGDEIKYKYNELEKTYEVEKCRIIKDTEWEYLEETEENRLTLITCVENQPEYRRCIQAVEKEEETY